MESVAQIEAFAADSLRSVFYLRIKRFDVKHDLSSRINPTDELECPGAAADCTAGAVYGKKENIYAAFTFVYRGETPV